MTDDLHIDNEVRRLHQRALDARRRLKDVAVRTPILSATEIDGIVGCAVYLKAEMYQRTGSFKFRGAYNRLAALPDSERTAVVAHSSGNFAQAVALAGQLLDIPVTVVMPENAPPIKVRATRRYGAEIVFCGPASSERARIAENISIERGTTLVQPYNDEDVIAGQATATFEILEDLEELDTLVVPLGGGGLLAGAAIAAKLERSQIRLIGVEPSAMPKMSLSIQQGGPVEVPTKTTVMDGQMIARPGKIAYPIISRFVDDVVTVDDTEAIEAMCLLHERLKIVAEPSGSSALAALLSGRVEAKGRVAVILSGGNVGIAQMFSLYQRAHPEQAG